MNNPHKNARTVVFSRGLMVQRVRGGKEVAQVARDFGVNRRTVYKWLSRYREGGEAGLENRKLPASPQPRASAGGAGGHCGRVASDAHEWASDSVYPFPASVFSDQ